MSRRSQPSDPITTALTMTGRGLLGIGKWLWRLVSGRPARAPLNKVALFADWQAIETVADSADAHRLAQAISQADRFVDHVMQLVGGRGASFADRLRSLEGRLGRLAYQELWDAHKLRNQLAHEHGRTISIDEAKQALSQFREAARQLGAF